MPGEGGGESREDWRRKQLRKVRSVEAERRAEPEGLHAAGGNGELLDSGTFNSEELTGNHSTGYEGEGRDYKAQRVRTVASNRGSVLPGSSSNCHL